MLLSEFINLKEKPGCNMTQEGRGCAVHGMNECPGYKMIETSAQEKLHQRHQEIRKKSGLPNPNYYKELKATFDLPDEERHVAVAALKKKYKIKEQAPTGHGQISTKYGADGTKVSFDPATGGKTVSGATGTTSYNVAGQKTAYQTPSIGGTSQTTNYQTGEKTTTGQVGGVGISMTHRPDQSTVKTASTNLGDVTATTAQGVGFGGAGKNVQQGGNQVSSITNAQGQTTSFIGQPTQQDVEKAIPQKPVGEAGPFSYGAKKPRKGSVADLAAQKRKEQEKGKQPVEPKDHRVGVARVVKDVAEAMNRRDFIKGMGAAALAGGGYLIGKSSATNDGFSVSNLTNEDIKQIDNLLYRYELYSYVGHKTITGDYSYKDEMAEDTIKKLIAVYGKDFVLARYKKIKDKVFALNDNQKKEEFNKLWHMTPAADYYIYRKLLPDNFGKDADNINEGVAEDQEDIVAIIDGVRSDRTYNDKDHAHNSLSKLVGYGKAKVAELYVNGEKVEHFELGKKYREFEPKSLDSTMSESSGVTKLNDYDSWLDRVDSLGAEKHMQKNQTLLVAQSWDGEKVGEFDIKRNQGWVMSPGISEGAGEKLLGKMIPGGASVFNAADAVRRYRSGDKVGAGIAAAGAIPITSIPAAAVDMARDKYYTGSFLPSDEQRDLANLDRQVADMEKKNWTKLPDGSERSPDRRTIRGPITKAPDEVTNEGIEQYLEELSRAGYEVITETAELCPECGGPAFADQLLAEKKDACYSKVKSRYKVWPSAYASGALVRCRKVGAKNWGNKSKK